jgi:hypothetical protein
VSHNPKKHEVWVAVCSFSDNQMNLLGVGWNSIARKLPMVLLMVTPEPVKDQLVSQRRGWQPCLVLCLQ